MTFQELQLIAPILKALNEEEYTNPTPIQEQAIPAVLAGRDVFGCAQTGTGKTAAFSLPIVQRLHEQRAKSGGKKQILSLILTPTRELALQIKENIDAYSRYTAIRCVGIVGGVSQRAQELDLQRGADILIATPGRLIDLLNQKLVNLSHVRILVLDEADRMLDMGFINDVKKIIAAMPKERQTLFFSATMPPEITRLVNSLLTDPVKVEITPVSSTVDRIEQSIYLVDKANKQKLLGDLMQDASIASALVFTRTKHGADRVARLLARVGVTAQAIHGNKSQNARQNALNNFKNGTTRVLVATDIAARGIDIEDLSHVINFNLPNISETYVHRIGRTGRNGMSGVAISFCEFEELPYLKDIQKLIRKTIPEVTDHPYPMQITSAAQLAASKAEAEVSGAPARKRDDGSSRNRRSGERSGGGREAGASGGRSAKQGQPSAGGGQRRGRGGAGQGTAGGGRSPQARTSGSNGGGGQRQGSQGQGSRPGQRRSGAEA
ncbi:DEAD/DEAH box helicase [Paenibacillus daejeonensis]|uniref:DEAD/DEAH box helicase n=1 Tax=Paenibacillus daejeonensis TaxID=135193 RepID=UPI000370D44E|nr:DEAD/DEAH box helicase [Paenibacillus daejeonensis]